jgi:Spy/CpxP family protein refolding chaperone
MKKNVARLFAAAFLASMSSLAFAARAATIKPLMAKDLANIPGKEALMITVSWPPGGSDPIHKRDAHVFV